MPVLFFFFSMQSLLNFKTQIWSNMLDFVFLKYISKGIESRLWHTVNHDLNVTLLIRVAKLDFWNLALYISRSSKGDMSAFDQPALWQQISFTASILFSPLPFLLWFDASYSASLPSLHTGLLPLPSPTPGTGSPSPFSSSPLPLQLRWQHCHSTNSCSTYKMDALLRAATTPGMSGRWEK